MKIFLKKGKEKKIKHFYPWVFRDEIERIEGQGIIAKLYDYAGNFLALGTYSPQSRIAFRVLSYEEEQIDKEFFKKRFQEAISLRDGIDADAFRVVFSESDMLSGIILDKYDDSLVLQVRSYPMEELKSAIVEVLVELFQPKFIYERSDFKGRRDEGLKECKGILYGKLFSPVLIRERDFKFLVDVENGLKTGFYLDQRDNRAYIYSTVKGKQRVLDLFCYTGSFSIYCAKKGASVLGVDINGAALEIAKENAKLNGVEVEFINYNAFDFIKETDEKYDLIIADPPAIAKTKKEKESILWAIWKLAYYSFQKLRKKGRLFICSCTYQISFSEMIKQIRLASTDASRRVLVKEINLQPIDHPYLPTFPESLYLKCIDTIVID